MVTGNRTEYGLLYWLKKEIEADDALELQVIATGAKRLSRIEPR